MNAEKNRFFKRELRNFFTFTLFIFGAWFLGWYGFINLSRLRELERVPRTEVRAVTPGEVNLAGRAQTATQTLSAPSSNVPTLYYRQIIERRERDSEGKTRWVTEKRESRFVDFMLDDGTASILVKPAEQADIRATRNYRRQSGNRRYTEYRIDPGDEIFIFGVAELARETREWQVGFTGEGRYTPIISQYGEEGVRRSMATISLSTSWLALALAAFAIFFLSRLLLVHRTSAYLATIAITIMIGLFGLGWSTAASDLMAALERIARSERNAHTVIGAELASHNMQWNGEWADLPSFESAVFSSLPEELRQRLQRIRLDMHHTYQRGLETWQRRPERWVARARSIKAPVPPAIQEEDRALLRALETASVETRLNPILIYLALGIGLILAIIGARHGFRQIHTKRLVENIPTSPSSGVTFGIAELKGKIELSEEQKPLTGPLSHKQCVYFHYLVREKRGSGKKSKWVTVEDRKEDMRFLVRDQNGVFPVETDGAEIVTTLKTESRQGKMRYSERRLDLGSQVYALGHARIDPLTESSLVLGKSDTGMPFLISNMKDSELMLDQARKGFIALNFGFIAALAAALAIIGHLGIFSGMSYFTAALVGPGYLGLALMVLIYNDLVFLRQRVAGSWANIEVSLKKRANLVPALEEIAKAYLQHERGLQAALAELRNRSRGDMDAEDGQRIVACEQELLRQFNLLREQYPDLRASQSMQHLHHALGALENEIALMRDGYNNAVESFNNCQQKMPELLIARIMHFKAADFFHPEVEVHEIES